MNWTPQDALRFHNWERDMMMYHAYKRLHPDSMSPPPRKPPGYDTWKAGPDPLKLASTQHIRCHGGGLVPENWTPSAQPATEATLQETQLPLI